MAVSMVTNMDKKKKKKKGDDPPGVPASVKVSCVSPIPGHPVSGITFARVWVLAGDHVEVAAAAAAAAVCCIVVDIVLFSGCTIERRVGSKRI